MKIKKELRPDRVLAIVADIEKFVKKYPEGSLTNLAQYLKTRQSYRYLNAYEKSTIFNSKEVKEAMKQVFDGSNTEELKKGLLEDDDSFNIDEIIKITKSDEDENGVSEFFQEKEEKIIETKGKAEEKTTVKVTEEDKTEEEENTKESVFLFSNKKLVDSEGVEVTLGNGPVNPFQNELKKWYEYHNQELQGLFTYDPEFKTAAAVKLMGKLSNLCRANKITTDDLKEMTKALDKTLYKKIKKVLSEVDKVSYEPTLAEILRSGCEYRSQLVGF